MKPAASRGRGCSGAGARQEAAPAPVRGAAESAPVRRYGIGASAVVSYPDESDLAPYPLPDNAPIEDWPLNGKKLETIQREGKGDRHIVVVDPFNSKLYELYIGRRTDAGWQAAQSSTFDLKTNKLRPAGWTSTDAAGLPIFPASSATTSSNAAWSSTPCVSP